MKLKFLLAALLAGLAFTTSAAAPKPLRVLLFAGGCCHDYAVQHLILKEGLEARAHVEVDAIHSSLAILLAASTTRQETMTSQSLPTSIEATI